jgi:hypothetical protein
MLRPICSTADLEVLYAIQALQRIWSNPTKDDLRIQKKRKKKEQELNCSRLVMDPDIDAIRMIEPGIPRAVISAAALVAVLKTPVELQMA